MLDSWPVAGLTGHRRLGRARGWVAAELVRTVRRLHHHETQVGISGLAWGSDTLWAHAVLSAWNLWAYIPFPQQADNWPAAQQVEYRRLLRRADPDRSQVFGESYDVRLYHVRDRAMVDDSQVLVAVWDPSIRAGGTWQTVKYAAGLRRPIIHVDPVGQGEVRVWRPPYPQTWGLAQKQVTR